MVVPDLGRGASYQKLQVSAMANFINVSFVSSIVDYGDTVAESFDGTLVAPLFPDAEWPDNEGIPRLVFIDGEQGS